MAISHASYIHKPEAYVAPVDLNLMGKVLQFKQGQYDQGVAKVQNNIDAIAAMDIVKGADKDYLTAKLNNLVATTNSIGGAQFDDPNVANQIAGLSSQIYGDDKILAAVGNTKKFRYVQGFYQNMKEKKPKDYNPANEWFDMQKFNGWLSDGQVGSSPEANAGKVTPFHDYSADWQKMFDKIAKSANITQTMDDKGQLTWRTTTQEKVEPERIWAAAAKMMTPAQRQQLGIEGMYTYAGVPPQELLKAYDSNNYEKLQKAQAQLEDYEAKYKGATGIKDQQAYEKLVAQKKGEVAGLLAPVNKNADQIKRQLYLDEKLKGLSAQYAFSKSTVKLQLNAAEAFRQNQNLKVSEFQYKQLKDNRDYEMDKLDFQVGMADKDLKWDTDMFGNRTIVRDLDAVAAKAARSGKAAGTGTDDFSGLQGLDNSMAEQRYEFGENEIINRKTALTADNQKVYQDFIKQVGRDKGLTDVVITDLMDDGRLTGVIDPQMQVAVDQMMQTWKAMAKGQNINYDKLPASFKTFADKYQSNLKEIQSYDKFTNQINTQVASQFGISGADQANADYYSRLEQELRTLTASVNRPGNGGYSYNESAYNKPTPEQAKRINQIRIVMGQLSPTVNSEKVQNYLKNREGERKKLFSSAGARFNLPSVTVTDDKSKNIAKTIAGNAGTFEVYGEDGSIKGKQTLDFEAIDPQSMSYSYFQTADGPKKLASIKYKRKTGSDADDFVVEKVQLTDQQAQVLGFGNIVPDIKGVDVGLHLQGEVKGLLTTTGNKYQLEYDIVKAYPDRQNDQTMWLRVKNGNNPIILSNRPFYSRQQAQEFIEKATKLPSINDAMQFLEELENQ